MTSTLVTPQHTPIYSDNRFQLKIVTLIKLGKIDNTTNYIKLDCGCFFGFSESQNDVADLQQLPHRALYMPLHTCKFTFCGGHV